MTTDVEPKPLDLGPEVVLGQTVEGVLHGVGGEDLLVVTGDVGIAVVAGEQHAHRQIGYLVAVAPPMQLEDPHPRFPVAVRTEHQLPR